MFVCLFVCSLLTTVSCDKSSKNEEQNAEVLRADWLKASLNPEFSKNQQQVSGYLFKPENLQELIIKENVDLVRLVLSFKENQINFSAVGVSIDGKELISFDSEIFVDNDFTNNILVLKNSRSTINSKNTIVSNHILNSKMAHNYIQKWQNELKIGNNLNSLTSYNNDRIHHFSLRKELIQEILNIQKISNVGLFIGVNTENKITTVLSGLDANNKIILPKNTGDFSTNNGVIVDFTKPCPETCDTKSNTLN